MFCLMERLLQPLEVSLGEAEMLGLAPGTPFPGRLRWEMASNPPT